MTDPAVRALASRVGYDLDPTIDTLACSSATSACASGTAGSSKSRKTIHGVGRTLR